MMRDIMTLIILPFYVGHAICLIIEKKAMLYLKILRLQETLMAEEAKDPQ